MPIHDFKKWAHRFLEDSDTHIYTDYDCVGSLGFNMLVDDLTNLLLKAYELGKNPNVEKLDK